MENTIAGTVVKEEMKEKKIEMESGAGETSSGKVETCEASEEDSTKETITGENRLTQEYIEIMRSLIKEDMKTRLYKEDLEIGNPENQARKLKTARMLRTTILNKQKCGH